MSSKNDCLTVYSGIYVVIIALLFNILSIVYFSYNKLYDTEYLEIYGLKDIKYYSIINIILSIIAILLYKC